MMEFDPINNIWQNKNSKNVFEVMANQLKDGGNVITGTFAKKEVQRW